jgi:hypothetical protein
MNAHMTYVLGVLSDLITIGGDPHIFVAGSAAIRPDKAEDIDVWVPKGSVFDPKKLPKDIWFARDSREDGYSNVIPVRYKYESATWDPAFSVQIMWLGECLRPIELLNLFDVSCHAYALLADGTQVKAPWATRPGDPITVREGCRYSDFTTDRIATFTARYQGD